MAAQTQVFLLELLVFLRDVSIDQIPHVVDVDLAQARERREDSGYALKLNAQSHEERFEGDENDLQKWLGRSTAPIAAGRGTGLMDCFRNSWRKSKGNPGDGEMENRTAQLKTEQNEMMHCTKPGHSYLFRSGCWAPRFPSSSSGAGGDSENQYRVLRPIQQDA